MDKTVKRTENGITLIALVVTIIVLLILAAVTIALLTGDNGILGQANRASANTKAAEAKDKAQMHVAAEYSKYLEEHYTNSQSAGSPINFSCPDLSTNAEGFTIASNVITIVPTGINASGTEVTYKGYINNKGQINNTQTGGTLGWEETPVSSN